MREVGRDSSADRGPSVNESDGVCAPSGAVAGAGSGPLSAAFRGTPVRRCQAPPGFARYGDIYLYAPVSCHRPGPVRCLKLMACSRSRSR